MSTLPLANTPVSEPKSLLISETKLAPQEVDARLLKLGVSERFLKANLEQIPAKILALVEGFFSGESFFLHGPCGVGKTYIMHALMRKRVEAWRVQEWLRDGQTSVSIGPLLPLFVSVPDFLLGIRASFNDGNSVEADLIRRYSEVEVLFLDDLGTEKPSEFALQTLHLLLDSRYNNERQTIISSNLGLEAIAERLSDRIASRIAGMCRVIQISGSDRRLKR